MKKYVMLMSYNSYLHNGLMSLLEGRDIYLFCEKDIDAFIKICSGALIEQSIVFYDTELSKITEAIFYEIQHILININTINGESVFEAINNSSWDKEIPDKSSKKNNAMASEIIYYYFFCKISYKKIATKLHIHEARVSYFINDHIRKMNFRNKNEFVLYLESALSR